MLADVGWLAVQTSLRDTSIVDLKNGRMRTELKGGSTAYALVVVNLPVMSYLCVFLCLILFGVRDPNSYTYNTRELADWFEKNGRLARPALSLHRPHQFLLYYFWREDRSLEWCGSCAGCVMPGTWGIQVLYRLRVCVCTNSRVVNCAGVTHRPACRVYR